MLTGFIGKFNLTDSGFCPKSEKMHSAVSLMISIVVVAIVTVFALGVSNLDVSSLRQIANANRSNKAFYAAEGTRWHTVSSRFAEQR
jgi:hypothetical protein